MVQLSDLPVELLQRIAAFLGCSSALSLTRVSHKLHAACYTLLVFKRIALHSLGDTLIIPRSESNSWPDGPEILRNASLSEVVRVAHAVERAARRAGGRYGSLRATREMQVDSVEEFQADFEQWLPQLLAWHHPAYRYLQDTSLLPVHQQLGRRITTPNGMEFDDGKASFVIVGFCLAYFALQSFSQLEDDAYASFETEHHIMKLSSDYMLSVCWGIKPPRGGFCRPTDSFDLIQGSACIVPMLYAIIGSGLFRRLPFPLPSKMQFYSFMDIPWVFNGSSALLSTCHIRRMTEATFLTGSWMGFNQYYTDQRLVYHQHFALVDHPMTDISIVVQASSEDRHGLKGRIHCSESSGCDRYGRFTLCGDVYHDGRVEFIKRYVLQDWEWQYKGVLVPFGIVGRWTSIDGGFGGHFWIWKKEWCNVQVC